jgi:hypothetical protein
MIRHFGEEVPDVKADPSVNGVDIVGFNSGGGKHRRSDYEASEVKNALRTFHGRFHAGFNHVLFLF